MSPINILLTGADGFTGRHFITGAKAAGHRITTLDADLTDTQAIIAQLQGTAPQAVVHLAAISFVGHADAAQFYQVNTIGTLNLLDALAGLPTPPQRILLASSANIYGNAKHSPIPEDTAPAPVNHYATSKLAMEHMARTYLPRLPIFFTRPFNYTGPGQAKSFLIPKLVDHFARRAPSIELGNMDVAREFNDVRFVCDAYLALLARAELGEIYNICSGAPVTLSHVLAMLTDMTGHQIAVRVNPSFVRSNEIHTLCGDPSKLDRAIGPITRPTIRETLQTMLEAA